LNEPLSVRKKRFEILKTNSDYHDVEMNDKGGLKAIHKNHKFDKIKGHYEKEVQSVLFNTGDEFILEKETNEKKQVEGILNGIRCGIKSLEKNNPRTIAKRIAQSVEKGADICILYFPNDFEENILGIALGSYKGKMPVIIAIHKDKIIKDGR